jgi:hypothetical protein
MGAIPGTLFGAGLGKMIAGSGFHLHPEFPVHRSRLFSLAAVAALSIGLCACAVTNGTVSNGWTAEAAANVEYSAATSLEKQLGLLEVQLPGARADIAAAGDALAASVITQVTDMRQGASPAAQGKDAAISTVLSLLPNIGGIIASAPGTDAAPNAIALGIGAIANDALYVGPAVLKANAGTTTADDVAIAKATMQTAAGAL